MEESSAEVKDYPWSHWMTNLAKAAQWPYPAYFWDSRVNIVIQVGLIMQNLFLSTEYGFIGDDFEKTVVIPGLSSFLIVRINSSTLVEAHATMPELISDYLLIEEKKWFIYDFSSQHDVWAIVENECTTQIEDVNNVQLNPEMFLDINDTIKLRLKSSTFKGG